MMTKLKQDIENVSGNFAKGDKTETEPRLKWQIPGKQNKRKVGKRIKQNNK